MVYIIGVYYFLLFKNKFDWDFFGIFNAVYCLKYLLLLSGAVYAVYDILCRPLNKFLLFTQILYLKTYFEEQITS